MPVNFKGGLLVNGENVTTETVVETLQEELNTKAVLGAFNGGGTGVDYADLATNLRTEQGANVEDAIAQLSPISVAVEDGDFAEMTDVKGRSFAYNQLFNKNDFPSDTANGITITNNGDGSFTLNGTATANTYKVIETPQYIVGHKYLIVHNYSDNVVHDVNSWFFSIRNGSGYSYGTNDVVFTAIPNDIGYAWRVNNGVTLNNVRFKPKIIDLTIMGIDTDDVDEALAALRAYGVEPTVYNEYSAGKIIDSQPNKIISRGFNQWDEEWESGTIESDGRKVGSSVNIRSKNYIKVTPDTEYKVSVKNNNSDWVVVHFYDKEFKHIIYSGYGAYQNGFNTPEGLFKTPSNCYYILFRLAAQYGTTYNHDICINVSNPSLNGTYKPFVKDEHALTLPVMRSAGSVADDKEMVRVGIVDLGTLNWSYDSTNELFYTTDLSTLCKKVRGNAFISAIYINSGIKTLANMSNLEGQFLENGALYLKNTSYTNAAAFKAAMSGVMLNYELATPVAQVPAINLPQNIKVYNGGTLETQYESPNTTPALVSMLYQVNLKNFVEGVGSKEDINWDPQNVASKTEVDKKANTEDIKSGALIARLADDLTPYSDASGAEQSNPFIINGTGTNNNTEIVTVGSYAFLKEKQGNTEKSENVLVLDDVAETTKNGVTFSLKNGCFTINGSPTTQYSALYSKDLKLPKGTYTIRSFTTITSGNYSRTPRIRCYTSSTTFRDYFSVSTFVVDDSVVKTEILYQFDNLQGTTISGAAYPMLVRGTTAPTTWSQGYEGLKTSDGVKLVSTGRNLINSQLIEKGTIDDRTGENYTETSGNYWRYSGYILATPNSEYYSKLQSAYTTANANMSLFFYDKDKNYISRIINIGNTHTSVPANCAFVRITWYLVNATQTLPTDSVFSPYYTPAQGGEGYDQYYPYEEPHVIDTGTEVLRSAGSARDIKLHDGTILRNVGVVDLGTLDFNASTSGDGVRIWQMWTTSVIANLNIKPALNNGVVANITCSKYDTKISSNTQYSHASTNDMTICISKDGYITIRDSSTESMTASQLKTYLSGVILNFELATPTSEQGTPFNESISINDYGMLYWLDENDELVGIPQGAKIFYPVNYKGFMDDLYSRVGGDSSALVTHDNIPINEIKDSYGRLRFVEGSANLTAITGLTITYNKWSLSGTHLTIVLEGEADNTLPTTQLNGIGIYVSMPRWLIRKIKPINLDRVVVSNASFVLDDYSTISRGVAFLMGNPETDYPVITMFNGTSPTIHSGFRIQFDLLIDLNE